jgi:hypothetical protein
VTVFGTPDVDIDIDGDVSVAMLDFLEIRTIVVRCAAECGVPTFSLKLMIFDRQRQRINSSVTYLPPSIFIDVVESNNVSLAFDLGCEMSPRAVNDPTVVTVFVLELHM